MGEAPTARDSSRDATGARMRSPPGRVTILSQQVACLMPQSNVEAFAFEAYQLPLLLAAFPGFRLQPGR